MRSTRGLKSKVLFGAACSVVILVSGVVFFPRAILFRISQLSPTIGYAVAHVYIQQLPLNEQHGAAHVIGDILYSAKPKEAVLVCDDSFEYGCQLADVTHMMRDNGLTILHDLNNLCLKQSTDYGACQHGVGHALVASSGYDNASLQEVVDVCLSNGGIFTGCLSGIFMEYNVRTTWGNDAVPRGFSEENLFHPCEDYQGLAQQACIYSLPNLWRRSLASSGNPSVFKVLGDYCRRTCKALGQCATCFQGIGALVPAASSFNGESAYSYCALAGSGKELLWCTEIAAHYINRSAPIEVGLRACEKLDSSDKVECERWARQEEMLFRVYKPVP